MRAVEKANGVSLWQRRRIGVEVIELVTLRSR